MPVSRLVEALLAVAGVWLLARDIPDLATTISVFVSGGMPATAVAPGPFTIIGLRFLVSLVTGLILILGRKTFARWIQPDEAGVEIKAEPLLAVGIALVGVYFFVSGVTSIALFVLFNSFGGMQSNAFWSGVISALLGIALFLFSPYITRFWQGQSRSG